MTPLTKTAPTSVVVNWDAITLHIEQLPADVLWMLNATRAGDLGIRVSVKTIAGGVSPGVDEALAAGLAAYLRGRG